MNVIELIRYITRSATDEVEIAGLPKRSRSTTSLLDCTCGTTLPSMHNVRKRTRNYGQECVHVIGHHNIAEKKESCVVRVSLSEFRARSRSVGERSGAPLAKLEVTKKMRSCCSIRRRRDMVSEYTSDLAMDVQGTRKKPQVQKADLSYSDVHYVRGQSAGCRLTNEYCALPGKATSGLFTDARQPRSCLRSGNDSRWCRPS